VNRTIANQRKARKIRLSQWSVPPVARLHRWPRIEVAGLSAR
jgi:hypothetical protein